MATTTKRAAKKTTAKKPAKPKAPLTIVTRTFNDGRTTHWYQIEGQNAKGRGVTTLLGNGLPAPGLKVWGENTVANAALDEQDIWIPLAEKSRDTAYEYLRKAADRDRDEAGNRGTEVHNYAERINLGEEVEVPDLILGHVDQYIDWLEVWQPEIEMVEVVGGNWSRWYFGKFDLLVKMKGWFADRPDDEALVLVDIKTSRSGPFEKDALQLTAYRHFERIAEPDEKGHCWDLQEMPEVDGCAVLMVHADSWRFIPVNPELDAKLFAQFLHCVRVAEFLGSGWKAEDKGWSRDCFDSARTAPYDTF